MDQNDRNFTVRTVTPDNKRYRGRNIVITYGYHQTNLGKMMIGQTEYSVCYLGFVTNDDKDSPLQKMRTHFPHANFAENDAAIKETADHIPEIWQGNKTHPLTLDLHGTDFQIQVWKALLDIPCGETVSYQDIAAAIGKPQSSRAVGNAVGANPVSLLVPCHRVIRKSGIIGHYGWGHTLKKLLLDLETRNEK